MTLAVRRRILPTLVERVRTEWWDEPLAATGEQAAWPALALTCYDGSSDATAEHDVRGKSDNE